MTELQLNTSLTWMIDQSGEELLILFKILSQSIMANIKISSSFTRFRLNSKNFKNNYEWWILVQVQRYIPTQQVTERGQFFRSTTTYSDASQQDHGQKPEAFLYRSVSLSISRVWLGILPETKWELRCLYLHSFFLSIRRRSIWIIDYIGYISVEYFRI